MTVYTGIDVLRLTNFTALEGRRVGLLTHTAAADERLQSTSTVLFEAPGVDLKALYSPEHGLWSSARDGEHVDDSRDPQTRLPVFSLYGPAPDPAMLDDIDLVVVDLVDVGARFYTYIWTMSQMMELCGERGVAMVVLDRPNPLGGAVRGLYGDAETTSMVGRYGDSMPLTHGLTIGELARYFAAEHIAKPPKVSVVGVSGWQRNVTWPGVWRPWVPPSPAMPHFSTVQHYPGAALLEGTTLSEGRGTALPFEITGAPGIDAHHLAERLNMQHQFGVRFRPHAFRPTASKHAGVDCQGVQVHITDSRYFDPLRTWLSVIVTVRALFPESFGWAEPHEGRFHFDRLIGNTWMRPMIDSDARVDELLAHEDETIMHFEGRRLPYLLYG
jgi:uncharacterized protein YbbC (DUF1343 family)